MASPLDPITSTPVNITHSINANANATAHANATTNANTEPGPAVASEGNVPIRRSSSQASLSSRHSQRARTVGTRLRKRPSHASSTLTTSDLTSFPSLSPERSPERFSGQPALNRALSVALVDDNDDAGRGRRTTLSKLTSPKPHAESGRPALFGDSILTHDFPGSLHLADDSHIERLIANNGAVKLVRQYARDLALRDAEFSALRQRVDARERELKRMLREVSVSNQDIDRRLYLLEHPQSTGDDPHADRAGDSDATAAVIGGSSGARAVFTNGDRSPPSRPPGLGDLMEQAMRDDVGVDEEDSDGGEYTIRAREHRRAFDHSTSSSSHNGKWSDYLFGKNGHGSDRKTRRGNVVVNGSVSGSESGYSRTRPKQALDQQTFVPPSDKMENNNANNNYSKLPKSISSWTRIFGGGPKEGSPKRRTRSNSPSRGESPGSQGRNRKSPTVRDRPAGGPAISSLRRINSVSSKPADISLRRTSRTNASHSRTSSVSHGANPSPAVPDTNPTNLGPVEMDAILPMESRPPTLNHVYNYGSGEDGLLTDPFGFIYDQRRKKRQREASATGGNRISATTETLNSFRSDASDEEEEQDEGSRQSIHASANPSTLQLALPGHADDSLETTSSNSRRWQDYLKIATRPTELLSHTPSAGPIVSLTLPVEDEQRQQQRQQRSMRGASFAMDKGGLVSVNSNVQPYASTSTVIADRPEFAGTAEAPVSPVPVSMENEPVRLLLEQLTELHDSLQRERTVRWNEFLRKVRAERRKEGEAATATSRTSDRSVNVNSVDMPEASLADGEIVGVSGLGNKGKVGRAKWREFRMLVLSGIPVALRAKVWSECSGASAMRVPGYYDDLVKGVGGSDPDPSVVAQVDMDIRRTLTDNVFFRKGPGVTRLREVLVSYARRNPEVGYCQGMNLIAASLLLITPTAEDAFWLLVSLIEVILPQHYYDHGLMSSRADQVVLRQYVTLVLPRLSAHLDALGIELEALTFQWFLSVFTDCLSAEALYRVWDVVLCLNVSSAVNTGNHNNSSSSINHIEDDASGSNEDIIEKAAARNGGGSTFLFQVALALLKLNENELLTTCSSPAAVYTYVNHQMTNHAISIDGLVQASEALRNVVRREDVVSKRVEALRDMQS